MHYRMNVSKSQLAEEFHVNRKTIQRALHRAS